MPAVSDVGPSGWAGEGSDDVLGAKLPHHMLAGVLLHAEEFCVPGLQQSYDPGRIPQNHYCEINCVMNIWGIR